MFNTFYELVKATREKFEGVTLLSRESQDEPDCACTYGPKYNNIGCAIGCHLPPTTEWENIERKNVVRVREDGYLDGIIGPDIEDDDLYHLQDWHDGAHNIRQFTRFLDRYLEENKELEEAHAT
jgi:hypothetical protein